mmetsp:Transcript_4821/g.11868  ORF Transcript_4821/g.11868 Transcript_4821/m.11868 type:complete len:225 (-) Transcript_4821:1886-2560(-)
MGYRRHEWECLRQIFAGEARDHRGKIERKSETIRLFRARNAYPLEVLRGRLAAAGARHYRPRGSRSFHPRRGWGTRIGSLVRTTSSRQRQTVRVPVLRSRGCTGRKALRRGDDPLEPQPACHDLHAAAAPHRSGFVVEARPHALFPALLGDASRLRSSASLLPDCVRRQLPLLLPLRRRVRGPRRAGGGGLRGRTASLAARPANSGVRIPRQRINLSCPICRSR